MSEAALPESDTTRLVLAQAKALQDLKKMKSSLDPAQYQDAVERISKSYKKMIMAAEANDECRKLEAKRRLDILKEEGKKQKLTQAPASAASGKAPMPSEGAAAEREAPWKEIDFPVVVASFPSFMEAKQTMIKSWTGMKAGGYLYGSPLDDLSGQKGRPSGTGSGRWRRWRDKAGNRLGLWIEKPKGGGKDIVWDNLPCVLRAPAGQELCTLWEPKDDEDSDDDDDDGDEDEDEDDAADAAATDAAAAPAASQPPVDQRALWAAEAAAAVEEAEEDGLSEVTQEEAAEDAAGDGTSLAEAPAASSAGPSAPARRSARSRSRSASPNRPAAPAAAVNKKPLVVPASIAEGSDTAALGDVLPADLQVPGGK